MFCFFIPVVEEILPEANTHGSERWTLESPPRQSYDGQHSAECHTPRASSKSRRAAIDLHFWSLCNVLRPTAFFILLFFPPKAPNDSLDFQLKSVYDHNKDFFPTKTQVFYQKETQDHRCWEYCIYCISCLCIDWSILGKKLNLKSDFSSFCTVKRTTTVARAQLRRNRQTSECGSTTRGAPFTASSEAERTVTWLQVTANHSFTQQNPTSENTIIKCIKMVQIIWKKSESF